jgi:hypothetical protein
MQVVNFSIPRLYDDVFFRIGGFSYDMPFAETKNAKLIPFNQSDFDGVDRRDNTEDLQTFFGINDNSPLPPTLTFPRTGRGRNLLNVGRLNALHAELQPIFGYPNWLSLSLKDWVKYEMKKENERWLNLNGANEIEKLQKELKDFSGIFQKNKASVSKLQFLFKMADENIKKQLQEPFFFFDTLADGAEYKKYIQPASYVNADSNNKEVIEIFLPKKYPLDYLKYLGFLAKGDKNIDITAWNTKKTANDVQIDLYFVAPTPAVLPFSRYPLFDLFPNLTPSPEIYSLIVFYEPKDFFVPSFKLPKNKEEKQAPEPEAPAEPESTEIAEIAEPPKPAKPKEKTTKPEVANWLIPLVVFFIVLVVLQKSSS